MILLYPFMIIMYTDITSIDSLFFVLIDETMGSGYSTSYKEMIAYCALLVYSGGTIVGSVVGGKLIDVWGIR